MLSMLVLVTAALGASAEVKMPQAVRAEEVITTYE